MDDPIGSHPTRAEQLDILTAVLADHLGPGDAVCELGIGVGYVAGLLLDRQPELKITGIDLKAEALETAREHLSGRAHAPTLIEADLGDPGALTAVSGPFRAIFTALTFHDLSDEAKARLIAWSAERLSHDGLLVIYDRLRLTEPSLFGAQQTIWSRIEGLYGRGMRAADDYDAYLADLGPNNRPAALDDYSSWLASAGLRSQLLHLHGNVALIGAAFG